MRLRPLLLAAVSVVVPASFSFAAATDARTTPFVSTLMEHFGTWDADQDGKLTRPEIERAATDPAVTGDAAAAAAALKQLSRSQGDKLPELTRAYFEAYGREMAASGQKESAKEAENATVDPGTSTASVAADRRGPATNWDRYFLAGKSRMASGGDGPIWRTSIDPSTIKQGPLGDCFFIAVTGSLALRDPERVHQLVQPMEDGQSFRASFPNSEPFVFAAPTQAMLAISGTSAQNGAWIAVMEQAYGKHRSRILGKSLDVDGTEVLRRGGDSMPTIQAITGHKARRISFARTLEERATEADKKLPELRQAIMEAIEHKRVAVCGILPPTDRSGPSTRPTNTAADVAASGDSAPTTRRSTGTLPTFPKAIVKKHVYAVVSYDPQTDVVELWNPHSNTFSPSGPEGLVNGYKTEKGRFKLPLSEAYRFYTSFTFETDTPMQPPIVESTIVK